MADKGSESFTPDVGALKEANDALRSMQSSGARTAAEMKSLQQAMATFSKLSKDMSKAALVDPRAEGRVKKLKEGLERAKITQEAINKLSDHEVTTYEKLGLLEKYRVRRLSEHTEQQKRMVMYGNRMVELEHKRNVLLSTGQQVWHKTKDVVVQNVRGFTNMVTSAGGLELSLMGILLLFMKMRDQQARIGAMSMQAAVQWQGSSTAIGSAQKAMGALRGEFGKSVDEAGEIVVSMARVGVEERGITNLARELTATQELYGLSVQESLGHIAQLHKSYGSTSEEASQFLRIARETTKTIPYLSMSEVANDMMELTQATRSYNTDLLGTLSLYSTLMKEDVAKHLGLGDAPEAVRKDIVKTVAGFNNQLGEGWKAALGEGATAASRILNFEKMKPAEQLQKMAQFITEKTSQFTGDEREFAVRQLLKQFNFTSNEMQKAMGEAFSKGGFSAEGLKNVVSVVGQQRDVILKQKEEEKASRQKLMRDAGTVAKELMGFEKKLAHAIEEAILGSTNGKKIMAWIGNMEKWIIEMAPSMIEKIMFGIATMGDLLEIAFGDKAKKRKEAAIVSADTQNIAEYFDMVGQQALTSLKEQAQNMAISFSDIQKLSNFSDTIKEATQNASAFPIEDLKEMVSLLSEFEPNIGKMSETAQRKLVGQVALQGIRPGEKFEGVDELAALVEAVSSKNVAGLLKLFKAQIRIRTERERQMKDFRGNFQQRLRNEQTAAIDKIPTSSM